MIGMKQKGLRVGAACAVVLMMLFSMLPGSPLKTSQKVEAYGENEDGTLFYAEATLYDYKYDKEINSGYNYTQDNQIAYKLQGGDQREMTKGQCEELVNGDRWMTGLQVPYELLNREISAYYSQQGASNIPALYLGNFLGTASNLTDERGNGPGQTPYQYTYGSSGQDSYRNVYTNYWQSANNAPQVDNGNVATQGLVDKTLKNGMLTQNNGAFELPLFSDSFISSHSSMMQKYPTSNGFPFNIINNPDGTKSYKFDSAFDATRYYSNGQFVIGTQNSNGVANWRSDGNPVTTGGYGFFPFNQSRITETEIGRSSVNYGFGMKVNIPFNLSENGTILDKDGNEVDVVFEFSGDDDVWVFVDNTLVLDLGGDHAKVSGKINFNRNKQNVWVSNATKIADNMAHKTYRATSASPQNTTISAMYQAAGVNFDANTFYNPRTEHTLTVFYMERGMFESNLSISFNFAPVNPHLLTVKEETKFNNINPALLKQTVAVADRDIFNYSIENKGTSAAVVQDSGFLTPTYDYINRNNTDEGNTDLINRLSGQTPSYVSQKSFTETTGFDDEFLYLDLSQINWADAGACMMAWVWGGSYGNGRYAHFAYDSNTGRYRIERNGATGMQLYRFKGGSYPNYGSSNFDDQNDKELWNSYNDSITIPSDKNVFKLTDWNNSGYWSSSTVQSTVTVSNTKSVLDQTTNNFKPNGTDYNPVGTVTYQLTDPFGDTQTTLNRDTTQNGTFGLMYGEEAFFQYQFQKDSTMRVKQQTTLLKPLDNRAENMGSQNGTRNVADYYYTSVNVKDIDNTEILSRDVNSFDNYNSSNGTYSFANAAGSTSKIVHLTETYINTVKVGDLVISKEVTGEDSSPKTFTFDVALNDLFGDDSGESVNIGNLQYEIFPKGTTDYYGTRPSGSGYVVNGVTITEDQLAVIKGIPVMTSYEVRERADADYEQTSLTNASGTITEGSYTYNPAGDVTGTIVSNEGASAVTASAVNRRKVGKLVITKQVEGEGADTSDSFPVTVILSAPNDAGIDLADFITANTVSVSGTVTNLSLANLPTITFQITHNATVTINNIPYGTTYAVREQANGYEQTIDYNDPGKVIDDVPAAAAGDRPDTVTITNRKDAARIVLTKKNDRSTAISGAEFAIYANRTDAVAKNNNRVDYATYSKNNEGTVFTFGKLKPNTTYYIAETTTPKGHTGLTEPLTITTGEANTEVTQDVINPVIEIVMPETGVLPSPLNMTVIGLSVIGIAALALILYRRKLQTEAAYTDEKEV